MRTQIVFSDDKKSGFITGLKWSSLTDYKGGSVISKEMREKATIENADKIVVHAVDLGGRVQACLGMLDTESLEDDVRDTHSLAVAFVRAFPGNQNSILAWQINDKRTAVIIVQGGLPIADEVKNHEDAQKLISSAINGSMGFSGHEIYSNNPPAYFNGIAVNEAVFIKAKSKSTRIQKLPMRKALLALVVMLVSGVAAGGAFAYEQNKKEKRRELMQKMAAEDPVPPYQELLLTNLPRMGLDKSSIHRTLKAIETKPVWQHGWQMQKINCRAGECVTTWSRHGGLTSNLQKAFPDQEILPDSTSETVHMREKVDLIVGGVTALTDLMPKQEARLVNENLFQKWSNAGIRVNTASGGDFRTWPTPVSGDLSRLPNEMTVKNKGIEVAAPYPLINELVSITPSNIWWESFTLTYSPGNEESLFEMTLRGMTYVR